jgi:hypothetical protein
MPFLEKKLQVQNSFKMVKVFPKKIFFKISFTSIKSAN